MTINHVNEIRNHWNALYKEVEFMANAFALSGMYKEANDMISRYYQQAYGATHFLVTMLIRNEYMGMAEEILALWNTIHDKKFAQLQLKFNIGY